MLSSQSPELMAIATQAESIPPLNSTAFLPILDAREKTALLRMRLNSSVASTSSGNDCGDGGNPFDPYSNRVSLPST